MWFALGMGLAAVVSVQERRPAARGSSAALPGRRVRGLARARRRARPAERLLGLLLEPGKQPYPKLSPTSCLTGLSSCSCSPAVWDAPRAVPQRLLAWGPLRSSVVISYGVYLGT